MTRLGSMAPAAAKHLAFACVVRKPSAAPSPPNKVVYPRRALQGCRNEEEMRKINNWKVRLDNGQPGGKTSTEQPPGPFGEFSRWRVIALIILSISEQPRWWWRWRRLPPPSAALSLNTAASCFWFDRSNEILSGRSGGPGEDDGQTALAQLRRGVCVGFIRLQLRYGFDSQDWRS